MSELIKKMRDFIPVSGEWFVLERYGHDYYMSRVLFWAMTQATEKQREHVLAVDEDGLPIDPDELGTEAQWFVYGSDPSPAGKTWTEVYQEAARHNRLAEPGKKDVTQQLPSPMPF